jgi:O-antigen/teichoic acid export membrane protein
MAFGHYLGFTAAATAIATVVVVGIAWLVVEPSNGMIVTLVAIAKASETIADMIHGHFQKHEFFSVISASQILKSVSGVITVWAILLISPDLELAVGGYAAVRLATLIGFDFRAAKRLSVKLKDPVSNIAFKKSEMVKLFHVGFPLGIVVALNTFQTSLPRLALGEFLDEAAVGYFAAMAYLVIAGAVIVNSWAQATLPKLARAYVESRAAYIRILAENCIFAILVGAAGIALAAIAGEAILMFVYTAEFQGMQVPFVWIMASGGVLYLSAVMGAAVTAARSFHSQALVAVLITVFLVCLLVILVPSMGITGAAMATGAAYGLKFVVQSFQVSRMLLRHRAP